MYHFTKTLCGIYMLKLGIFITLIKHHDHETYRREGFWVLWFQKNKLISTGVHVAGNWKLAPSANMKRQQATSSYEVMKSKLPLLIRTQTSESHFIECSLNLLLLINSSGNKMKMNNVSINTFATADCFILTQCLTIHSWMLFGTCVPLSLSPF